MSLLALDTYNFWPMEAPKLAPGEMAFEEVDSPYPTIVYDSDVAKLWAHTMAGKEDPTHDDMVWSNDRTVGSYHDHCHEEMDGGYSRDARD